MGTEFAFAFFLWALLTVAAVIDLRTLRIPDGLNAFIVLVGIVRILTAQPQTAVSAAIGAALGYGLIWGVNALHRARRGHDGIGMGDAKLLAAGGIWVGWFGVPFVVLIAASAALVAVAVIRLAGRPMPQTAKIAFGPFLALGIGAVHALHIWMA